MTDFEIAFEIQAPPEVVWSHMRDVERWPEWTPTVRSVKLLDSGPLRAGSRAIIRQPKLPPAKWRVTELDDRGRSFTWVSASPGVSVIARHWVEARGMNSRAILSLRFTGMFAGLLGRLTRGLNERYLALEGNGLKQRSESLTGSTGIPK
ncbi:MAG TPA: SRPBCC family protein [Bryobacteraceae bacterium]|nr:SRPBCC family protein [Bryobacteraceae bacterium]HUI58295.1 SRPBCC family protein [Bryobacteraceae bacterium]